MTPRAGPGSTPRPVSRRRLAPWICVGFGLLLLVAGVIVRFWSDHPSSAGFLIIGGIILLLFAGLVWIRLAECPITEHPGCRPPGPGQATIRPLILSAHEFHSDASWIERSAICPVGDRTLDRWGVSAIGAAAVANRYRRDTGGPGVPADVRTVRVGA